MATSAHYHTTTEVLTNLDMVRENLFEITRATERDPVVQHEVAEAFRWLDAAIGLLLAERG